MRGPGPGAKRPHGGQGVGGCDGRTGHTGVAGEKGEGGAWWEDAVVYEVYPRRFADADGNGVGDLPGLRSRLPYLADLGVDAIWLTPFYPSPLADGGYDVSDYRGVDPLLGSMADFDALVKDVKHTRSG